MSLDKAIRSGKEKRKPYRGSKAIDHTCRNHGSCAYCQGNRTYQEKKMAWNVTRWVDEVTVWQR